MKRLAIMFVGLVCFFVLVGGCAEPGFAIITIDGIDGPIDVCVETPFTLTGSNFLSEHGLEVTIRFTAETGTPFDGSDTLDIPGVVINNNMVEGLSPEIVVAAQVSAFVTVILPGGVSGTSALPIAVLQGGAFGPPQAINDMYSAVGNVTLTVDSDNGVLENDIPGGCQGGMTQVDPPSKPASGASAQSHLFPLLQVVSFQNPTAQGGTVSVAPDGSFVYEPPLGLGAPLFGGVLPENQDSFMYTLEQDGQQSSATVFIDIENTVWFVDDTASPGGDGRFITPFNSLPAFSAVQGLMGTDNPEPGDIIFIYQNAGAPYDGGIALLPGQELIGNGVDLMRAGMLIVPAAGPPTLINTTNPGIGESIFGAPVVTLSDFNIIDGVDIDAQFGTGIFGDNVNSVAVDNTMIRDAAVDGVFLIGGTGTFAFSPTTSITDPGGVGIRINDQFNPGTPFNGDFVYEGDLASVVGGSLIDIFETTPTSSITFANGMISHAATGFPFSINFESVAGTMDMTSPQLLTGDLFIGMFAFNSSGTFTFSDTTLNFNDGGLSGSGVEMINDGGASFTFTDLDITITGDPMAVPGGVGIRAGNFASGATPYSITVDGTSQITTTEAEDAVSILGGIGSELNLDMTFASLTCNDSPQATGLFIGDTTGSFTVTGATTIGDVGSAGILLLRSSTNFTFSSLTVGSAFGVAGRGIDLVDSSGTFSIASGSIANTTLDGIVVDNSNLTLNNMAFSNIGTDVVDLTGTLVNLSGTGNTAVGFGSLCANTATTVNGTLDFGALGTCP